jgi:hypothetical protein
VNLPKAVLRRCKNSASGRNNNQLYPNTRFELIHA